MSPETSAFFISLTTIVTGFLVIVIRYIVKSNCANVNMCCGVLKFDRIIENNVDDENSNKMSSEDFLQMKKPMSV